jgi:carbamoyltransferase
MRTLGVSCYYHDSAAALVEDGEVLAAIEEERLTRRKHDSGFPRNAIRFCLQQASTPDRAIDTVVFYDKPLKKLERALVAAKPYGGQARSTVDWHLSNFRYREARIAVDLREAIGYDVPINFCEHHLSHAASAFYCSPFEEAAVLTVDGVGEWATTGVYTGSPRGIRQLKEIRYPHSIGLFYAAMTSFLGFEVNEGEYKVMGLASYGRPNFDTEVSKLLTLNDDGSFYNDQKYYSYAYDSNRMYSPELVDLLGPARDPSEPVTQRHMDIAASLQKLCEEALIRLARSVRNETGLSRLCMSGGVAHNVVANSRIQRESGFSEVWIHPASGDSGGAIGAAMYGYFQHAPGKWRPKSDYDTCIGPSFSNEDVAEALSRLGAQYHRVHPQELPQRAAKLISENFIIGWFQGRMEFGPRALGCRSILANACNPGMKDILNARVKLREDFRPFAPAILEEYAHDYFDMEGASPYMLFCPQVRPEKRAAIPAVTHVDGSARVQTVSRAANEKFYALIVEVQKITGVPVVVNTSFNVRGEPIVCTPDDAVKCFNGTDIDFLIIGDFIVSKQF